MRVAVEDDGAAVDGAGCLGEVGVVQAPDLSEVIAREVSVGLDGVRIFFSIPLLESE